MKPTRWKTKYPGSPGSRRARIAALLLVCMGPFGSHDARALDGRATYEEACAACHDSGAAGAPRSGVAADWTGRLSQPRAVLERHTLQGIGAMPAKGGRDDLGNGQVLAAMDYLLGKAAAAPARPAARSTPPSPSKALSEALKGGGEYHVPPGDADIPQDKYGDDVRLGQRIFTETWKYARRYSGNRLSCSNCHLDAGRKPNAAPLWAAFGMYPAYRAKNDRTSTLEERIAECFRYSMNGIQPAIDTPEVRALVAYSHFLAKGVPIGTEMPGRGFPQVVRTGLDPNPSRGAVAYRAKCQACHGADGAGRKNKDGGYLYPALWGLGAYNKGAGLYNNALMAGFLKANMPPGQDWSLSDQEALDLATYINLQLRPGDPRKGLLGFVMD